MVTLVVTMGRGSMDLYSSRLAQHLPVPRLVSDIYQRSCEVYNIPWLSPLALRSLVGDLEFWWTLRQVKGVIHLPNHHLARYINFLSQPVIITVHDLIRYRDLTGRCPQPLIHRPNARDRFLLSLDYQGIRKAAHIIAVSNYTKEDLVHHLGIPPERVSVVHHGVDPLFRPLWDRRPLPHPYILFVGSEHPRKNLPFLFHVFTHLKQEFPDLKLVKVGRAGGREADFRTETLRALRRLGLEGEVLVYDFVPPDDLARFYSHAEVFCFPSLFEGFGWPPLEAMACGCPVVASSATAIPEVVGDAGLLRSPTDVEGWVQAVRAVLSQPSLRQDLVAKGLARARLFTWERAARKTLEVYEEVEHRVSSVSTPRLTSQPSRL